MPAYKARYLARTLQGVAMQTYRPLELVVCDDSSDGAVEAVVQEFAAEVDFPVHYSRNPKRLWETASTARGIAIAQGHYVKFLHDDDVMEPECIAALVAAMENRPGVMLASSRRRRINPVGRWLPDIAATLFPFTRDVLVDGSELVSFLADHTINFIGEPSCVLCRREDLLPFGDRLPWLGDTRIHWVSDLALYAKLLQHGDLALLAAPLVNARQSPQQFSQAGRTRVGIGEQGHADFRAAIRRLGWYRHTDDDAGQVSVAPLDGSAPAQRIDLQQLLADVAVIAEERWQLHEWQARRAPVASISDRLDAWLRDMPARPTLGILVMATGHRLSAVERTVARLALQAGLMECITFRVCDAPAGTLPAGVGVSRAGMDAASLDAELREWDVGWLLVVQAGTQFTLAGLVRLLVELAHGHAGTHAVFADEWHRDHTGAISPILRPALDTDLLLANPSRLAGHWVIRRSTLLDEGGFSAALDGVAGLDLALRVLERHGADAVVHMPEPLLFCESPQWDESAQHAAIGRHLAAVGHDGASVEGLGRGLHRIRYTTSARPPVSVVVIASTELALLQRCVLSVLEKTTYPAYELLLVDNGTPAEGRQWMEQVAGLAGERVRAFALDPPVPHAAACNLAAGQARGRFLLFLHQDAAVVQPQWLELLVEHGLRPGIGAAGARTVSADGKVTHAGLVPGLVPAGSRAFHGESIDAPGYLGRLQVAHGCAAVADDCMLVDAQMFAQLGGFDAEHFSDGGADMDLCLRIRQAGRRVVCVPDALLLHAPTLPDVAQTQRVNDALYERWLPALAGDGLHHPSLRLDATGGFNLAEPDLSWRQLPAGLLPRVLAQPADPWGSGQYRVIQPFEALRASGMAEGACTPRLLEPLELARVDPDVVVLQRRLGGVVLASIERMQRFSPAFRVYELDDWLPGLPMKSAHRADMPKDITASLRQVLVRCDRLVVSTHALAEAMSGFHGQIRVVQNRLEPKSWSHLPAAGSRPEGGRPRVGWAGGIGHAGDLEMIAEVVRELAGEVDWVFFGLCPEKLRPYIKEFHQGVDFHAYSRALALLDLDLALAPLEDNRFNQCKSNLRLLEYGACGYPVVCSDLEPYRGDLPVTRVRNRHNDWVGAIRQHLADRDASAAAGLALREAVRRDWILQGDALQEWLRAWLPD
ncbi:glycosyltransferase [Pseudoxanthomonas koreensis]|uniref:glycosyltransferase n=1 Tax=Pseudoxanthomonas koreensis TaxID=266061 RepID=UPI0035A59527